MGDYSAKNSGICVYFRKRVSMTLKQNTKIMTKIQHIIDILHLEDEISEAYLLKKTLKEISASINLHHVNDGLEGLDFLSNKGKYATCPRPDLIFLDLNMPRLNGHEFLWLLKSNENLKSIPVVVLSTSGLESDILASYESGASGYITKPMDNTQYNATIKQICDYWFSLVHLPKEHKK